MWNELCRMCDAEGNGIECDECYGSKELDCLECYGEDCDHDCQPGPHVCDVCGGAGRFTCDECESCEVLSDDDAPEEGE